MGVKPENQKFPNIKEKKDLEKTGIRISPKPIVAHCIWFLAWFSFGIFTLNCRAESAYIQQYGKESKEIASFLKGCYLFETANYQAAEKVFSEFVKADEFRNPFALRLAQVYVNNGKLDGALALLGNVLEKNSSYTMQATLLSGTIMLLKKQKDAALKYFNEAIKKSPAELKTYLVLNQIYIREKLFSEAVTLLENALSLMPERESAILPLLGENCVNAGQFDKAFEIFSKLIHANFVHKSYLLAHAESAFQTERWLHAEESYKKLLQLNPLDVQIFSPYCHTMINLGKFAEVLAFCEQWKIIEPQRLAPLVFSVNAFMKMKQYDEGIKYLLQYQESYKNREEYFYWLGRLYHMNGNFKEAQLNYEECHRLNPKNKEALYIQAKLSFEMSEIDQSMDLLLKNIELNPDHSYSYNFLGYLLAEHKNRYDEAILNIEKALKLEPENPYFLDSIGWTFYLRGNLREAEIYLKEALKRSDDTVIFDHLRIVQQVMDDQK